MPIAKTKTRKAESVSAEPRTLHTAIQDRLNEDADYAAANREVLRLESERAALVSERDRLRAEAGDVNGLVAKIESGEALTESDIADRLEVLGKQIEAYQQAINRAKHRKQTVLSGISRSLCREFAADHLECVRAIHNALQTLETNVKLMDVIPAALRKYGVSVSHESLPMHNQGELLRLVPRFSFIRGTLEPYLTRKGIDQ
jgi:hypothetical protein